MNKEIFSRYGSIIAMVLVLAVMITFAAPFGNAIASGVNNFVNGFGSAMNGNAGGGGSGSSGIKLDAPTNLTLTNDQLSFDLVPNANQYILYVNDEVSATYATSPIDVSTYIETYGTPITFKLVASDSTGAYSNSAATEYTAAGDGKMILKAGTYRFNEYLDMPEFGVDDVQWFQSQINLIVNDIQYDNMGYVSGSELRTTFGYYTSDFHQIVAAYYSDKGWQGDYQSHTILKDADVDETFGTWYISNTNYNEVNGATDEESVLGLRRFKDSVTPILELTEDSGIKEFFDNNYFEIEPITVDETLSFVAFTPAVSLHGTLYITIKYSNGDIEGGTLEAVKEFAPQFTVTSTANSTVDEWLLANTEPVEQEDDDETVSESVVGTWILNETLTTTLTKAVYYNVTGYYDFTNANLEENVHLDFNYLSPSYSMSGFNFRCNLTADTNVDDNYVGFFANDGMANAVEYGSTSSIYAKIGGTYYGQDTEWYKSALSVEDRIKLRTFTITGGADTNKKTLVTWLKASAKRVIEADELPTENIDTKAIYKVNELVSTWAINEVVTAPSSTCLIDFECNGKEYTKFSVSFGEIYYAGDDYSDFAYSPNSGWQDDGFRTINVTSAGTAATNWLQSNATKQGAETIAKYYQYVDGAWVEQQP